MCDHCGCRDLTPVARLMDEHDRLRELSGHIRSHVVAGDDAAARAHFHELLVVLAPHVAKEEGSLFPMLARSAELVEHVGVLEAEHAGFYDDVDDLDGLFPAALATLHGSDWDEVDRWEQEHLTAAGHSIVVVRPQPA